jgi:hypothetical protein
MLLPTLGNRRLPRKQSTKILKRDSAGQQRQHRRTNCYRHGPHPPPTPKRNCFRFAQRHTATSRDALPPGGGNPTDFFMVRLTLRRR